MHGSYGAGGWQHFLATRRLVDKSGLLDLLGIEAGQDLQKDVDTIEAAATLMGSLLFLKSFCQEEDAETQKMLWCLRGKEALSNLKNSE